MAISSHEIPTKLYVTPLSITLLTTAAVTYIGQAGYFRDMIPDNPESFTPRQVIDLHLLSDGPTDYLA